MSTVIQIENLWKEYRLGVIGYGTLTADLQSWWAKVCGKEDPNSKIPLLKGQEKQIEGDHFWALRGIDLQVNQGEVLGIIGRNGAGKSTLLKILSRVTAPTRGRVMVKGRIASLLEVGTGFHPELTGRENIFLNGAILGMSKQEIRAKFDEIVDFSGVADFIDTPVKRYSSGMYVRLAFAVAAHLEPEIMIVDEVLAVGDLQFQEKCLGKMESVGRQGRTVLFVSHNVGAVEKLCGSVVWIENGVVEKQGDKSEVIEQYMKATSAENDKKPTVTGTGEVEVTSIGLLDEKEREIALVQVGQQVILRAEIQAHVAAESLVFAFNIKNKSGQVVYGTNTGFTKQNLTGVSKGDKYRFDIQFSANLGPGTYSVQTSLANGNGGDVKFEQRENAHSFTVVNASMPQFNGPAWIDTTMNIRKM